MITCYSKNAKNTLLKGESSINMGNYYEEHVIAFIDILGFKEHIEKITSNVQHAQVIHDCLTYLSDVKKDIYESEYPLTDLIGKEVSVFLDSIVLSYPLNETSAVFYLLLDVIHIQLELMAKGILLRGGITVGQLYHKNGVVYGPAMNEAYRIESKNAIYPRVVVDKNVLIEGVKNGYHSSEEEFKYISSLLMTDEDKQLAIDFMYQYQEVNDEGTYKELLEKIREVIIKEIDLQVNPSVLQKYIWLKQYFNKTISKFNGDYWNDMVIE